MTWHLIGPSNSITYYLYMKQCVLRARDILFEMWLIYFTQIFPICPEINLNSQLVLLSWFANWKKVTFRLEADDGRKHF